jgi:galactose mutarotase-like enzyme
VIAIEPMTAPTNALVTGERLTRLAPGESYRATFTVRLSPA